MKCAVQMGSFGMIYIPSFIKIGSCIQKLIGVIHRQTARIKREGKACRVKSIEVETDCLLLHKFPFGQFPVSSLYSCSVCESFVETG
jgi:hypothetical protein